MRRRRGGSGEGGDDGEEKTDRERKRWRETAATATSSALATAVRFTDEQNLDKTLRGAGDVGGRRLGEGDRSELGGGSDGGDGKCDGVETGRYKHRQRVRERERERRRGEFLAGLDEGGGEGAATMAGSAAATMVQIEIMREKRDGEMESKRGRQLEREGVLRS